MFSLPNRRLLITKPSQDRSPGEKLADEVIHTEKDWSAYQKMSFPDLGWRFSKWWTQLRRPGAGERETTVDKSMEDYSLEATFELEQRERQALREEAIIRYQKQLDEEMAGRLNQKQNQLQYEVKEAINEKRGLLADELAEFQQQIEMEYGIQLTNIQFKLKLPGLPQTDRVKLEGEVKALEDQLKKKIEEETQRCEEKAEAFAKRRRTAASEEFYSYQQRLIFENRIRLEDEKDRLEEDYLAWKKERKREMGEE